MSQSKALQVSSDSPSKTSTPVHHTQVAPQHPTTATAPKTKETVDDPHHVKSPLPDTATTYSTSRPTPRTNSFKGPLKGSGFLSLLLCCTFGAASLLDNGDKPTLFSRRRKKGSSRHSHDNNSTTSTDLRPPALEKNAPPSSPSSPTSPPALPKIFTNPTDLAHFSSSAAAAATVPSGQQQDDPSVVSATPRSIPPQSPDAGQIMWLLPPLATEHAGRKCLVLDLDETLVHSSFKVVPNPDFIVPVEIDNQYHSVYVLKRPGVDEFMRRMGEMYEVVVFTASLSKYADPVLDMLDIHKVVTHRLFRESCYNHKGTYVKDLSQLGRELSQTLILDNSPASYIFHNANAIPVSTWFSDPHDTELTDLISFLDDMTTVDDVTLVLDSNIDTDLSAR